MYGTSNGGRSWHRILRGRDQIFNLQRTSVGAGFVSTDRRQFLTVDAGRHWYLAGGADLSNALGRSRVVFWSDETRIYELRSWPPRRLRCRTGWIGDPGMVGAGPRPRNICDAPTVVRPGSRLVYTLHAGLNDELFLAALVPGGVAGFVVADNCGGFCNASLRVLVYRNGRGLLRELPPPPVSAAEPTQVHLEVDWPHLIVTGARGYWISDDGGQSWRFVGG